MLRSTRLALGLSAALVGTGALMAMPPDATVPSPASPGPAAAGGCSVAYTVVSQWRTGFTGNVMITNTGSAPVYGWRLTFSFTAGQVITRAWNATATQAGARVTLRHASFNGSIAAGASVVAGFDAGRTGGSPAPAAFALNGTACRTAP
ncbi:cellulose-binding domain-containing protein [Krasilnikovia sp. MM14-A1259]|uniref:cellulose-binding domain-containing protein n=1 Tax=Krasilnikovia sp. MM14-A1259 TaxID=3373539 RepID=UPI0038256646